MLPQPPEMLIQLVWGRASPSAFFKAPQGILMRATALEEAHSLSLMPA